MIPQPGTRFGSYEVIGPLGAGGMGEVYRARDTRLNRDVAIKVLPGSIARDKERLARFQREAHVLASLNHPNVGAIYDLDHQSETPFIVLELIEGETLAARIARGPLTFVDVVNIGRQIAEALEAAHDKGIVHRDLKPANIKVATDGRVKLLDFGIAKMYEPERDPERVSDAPTSTSLGHATAAGVILGTVSYMSPEQARGQEVTRQADVWAFGCVLLEMLTGRQAFSGGTASDTIARILTAEPDVPAAAVPARFRRIIERCLAKDSRRRYRDAGDVRLDLEDALASPSADAVVAKSPVRTIALAMLLALAAGAAGWGWLRTSEASPASGFVGALLSGPALAYGPRVSPDGNTLAFKVIVDGMSQVAVMTPKSGNWTVLTSERNSGLVESISWSPDGTRLLYSRGPFTAFSVPALGGEPRRLLENASFPHALADGSLIFLRMNADRRLQLHRSRQDTGGVEALDALLVNDPSTGVPTMPFRVFPDGRDVVYFGTPATAPDSERGLYLLNLATNHARRVTADLHGSSKVSGLAIDPADKSILVGMTRGDVDQVVRIPTTNDAPYRVVATLTNRIGHLDVGPEGSIYLDQINRPMQVVRFTEHSRGPEGRVTVPRARFETSSILELPDGQLLFSDLFGGRSRLLVSRDTGVATPFLETDEDSSGPAVLVGKDRVAFFLGRPPERSIALASTRGGGILSRIRIAPGNVVASLTATDDGATLFFSDAGSIWSVPSGGGEARKLGDGDGVTFDPLHRDLVIQLNSDAGARLGRMPTTGGHVTPIPMLGEGAVHSVTTLGPNAVRRDGAIVLPIAYPDSWFFGAAVLDPRTGQVRRVPFRFDADFATLSWNGRGEIIGGTFLLQCQMWRFFPQAGGDVAAR